MVGNVDNDAWIKCKWCTQSTAVCEHWWFARFIYKEYCSVSLLSGLLRRYCVVIFLVSCKPFVKPRTIWLLCNSYSFPVTFSLKYFIALGFWFRVVHCLVSLGNFKTKIQTKDLHHSKTRTCMQWTSSIVPCMYFLKVCSQLGFKMKTKNYRWHGMPRKLLFLAQRPISKYFLNDLQMLVPRLWEKVSHLESMTLPFPMSFWHHVGWPANIEHSPAW